MPKVNQKDIADSLNISRVTVTKALGNHPDIALKTRQRVKEKAQELGYFPSFIGRSLSSRRTHTIGLVIPKISHSFFYFSIEKMYEIARESGYTIIPMVSFEDCVKEIENVKTLLSMNVEAIILDSSQNSLDDNSYQLIKNAGCKFLYYDRLPVNGDETSAVLMDDKGGAMKSTEYLIRKGYKRIAHFAGPDNLNISFNRRLGYEEMMSRYDLKPGIIPVHLTEESGYRTFKEIVKNNDLPDAIFAVNDPVAHGVYRACKELKLNIPGDIAVMGFGDVEKSAFLDPPMTSVRPPIEKMAEEAIHLVFKMIDDDVDIRGKIIFPCDLIERSST
jgi:LacI family transcriptional regulator